MIARLQFGMPPLGGLLTAFGTTTLSFNGFLDTGKKIVFPYEIRDVFENEHYIYKSK